MSEMGLWNSSKNRSLVVQRSRRRQTRGYRRLSSGNRRALTVVLWKRDGLVTILSRSMSPVRHGRLIVLALWRRLKLVIRQAGENKCIDGTSAGSLSNSSKKLGWPGKAYKDKSGFFGVDRERRWPLQGSASWRILNALNTFMPRRIYKLPMAS